MPPAFHPHVYRAAAFFVGSGFLFHEAWKIKDYDNAQEVKKMQQQALHLPFAELVKVHGLDRIQKSALTAIDEAITTIRDNKIGGTEQDAYERELEPVRKAYDEKIIPLSARLQDTIKSLLEHNS